MDKENYSTNGPPTVQYNLAIFPRCLKKVFQIDGVEQRFLSLLRQICEDNSFVLQNAAFGCNYCLFQVAVPPVYSPAEVAQLVRTGTSGPLRREFAELSKIPSLWMRVFFASTDQTVSEETIRQFADKLKDTKKKE